MLKQVFLAHFEPLVTRFGREKILKCLEKRPFWDLKWVKNGSKTHFSKSLLGLFGVHKQMNGAHFDPVSAKFCPLDHMFALSFTSCKLLRAILWKVSKSLEKGPFWDEKWVKKGAKTHFFKSDGGRFRVLKQVFLPHFGPVVTRFGPSEISKCFENGPFWDQKSVKNGSKPHFIENLSVTIWDAQTSASNFRAVWWATQSWGDILLHPSPLKSS